jgi:hypothetical protein
MAMASVTPAEGVMESAIIVIPQTNPHAGETLDLTFVAAADANYIVARTSLAASVRPIRGTGNDLPPLRPQDKRQSEALGELVEEAGPRPKGMSYYLSNLDGKKLYARNKTGKRTLGSYSLQWINRKWIVVCPRTFCYKWRRIDQCYASKGILGRMTGTLHLFRADS